MDTRVLTIFFADAKEEVRELLDRTMETHGGKLLKVVGSACLFGFDDTLQAARAAMQLQIELRKRNAPGRIALTRGEVTVADNEIFGEPVNLAARLEGIAEPGDIYLSESVYRAISTGGVPCREVGMRQFKGISQPVAVFKIGTEPKKEAPPDVPPVQPREPAKAELFDFSRVEQERMQERKAIAAIVPKGNDSDAVIPLAEESLARKGTVAKKATMASPAVDLRQQARNAKLKSAVIIFVGGVIVLPSLLLGGFWMAHRMKEAEAQKVEQDHARQLEDSEVLKSMKAPRRRFAGGPPKLQQYATLVVYTQPSVAEVYIDGRLASRTTPARIKHVPAEVTLKVAIKKPGFEDNLQLLNLSPDEEKELEVSLAKIERR